MARRTLALAVSLTLLLFALQLLRALDSIALPQLPLALLAKLALAVLPSLLVLTLPIALLVATALTIAEAQNNGELLGWRSLGGELLTLMKGPTRLAWGAAVVVSLCTAWLGPHFLDEARRALLAHTTVSTLERVAPGASITVNDVQASRSTLAIDHLSVIEHPGRIDIARLTLSSKVSESVVIKAHNPSATLHPEPWHIQAQTASIELPPNRQWHAIITSIPEIETRSIPTLVAHIQEPRAAGQLVKRLVLAIAPLFLPVLILGLLFWPGSGHIAPAKALLVALLAGLVVFAAARGGELLTQTSVAVGCSVAALIMLASALLLAHMKRRLAARW